jgi:hypothetical protein
MEQMLGCHLFIGIKGSVNSRPALWAVEIPLLTTGKGATSYWWRIDFARLCLLEPSTPIAMPAFYQLVFVSAPRKIEHVSSCLDGRPNTRIVLRLMGGLYVSP